MDRNRPPVSWSKKKGDRIDRPYRLLFLLPVAFLVVFFFYPLAAIFGLSFADGADFGALIGSSYYLETLWFTTWQAAVSTTLTVGLALPGAYVFARFDFPGKSLLTSLSTLAFVLPTVVVAVAFSALIGSRGLINNVLMQMLVLDEPPIRLERTLALILIVHVFYNYAVALRMISSFWAGQSVRMEEAARVLGAHGWRLWWEIRLPALRPALLAAATLIFIFTFTSFGVVLILGGPRFATLEVEIYRQAANLFNLPVAAALSLVQIGLMFALLLVYTRLQRQMPSEIQVNAARKPQILREKLVVGANVLLIIGFLLTPLVALVIQSVTTSVGFSTQFYRALGDNPRGSVLFVPPLQAIGNSVVFALATTVLAVLLGVMAAYLLARREWRWLDPVFMLPLATSAVTLGFGFIIALDEPPLNLRASPTLIPIAHTLVAMPFVVRSVLPAIRAIPPSIPESAQVLGARPRQVWRLIDLPLISRGLIVGATFAFTVSMGEFGASLFVARPDTPTMPLVIFRLLGQPGAQNYGQALAMSSLLMSVCAVSFLLIERLRSGDVGEI